MSRLLVERIKYGRYVVRTKGETMTGEFYTFTYDGNKHGIGGKHNYRIINKLQYFYLSAYFWLISNFMKKYHKRIIDNSWI